MADAETLVFGLVITGLCILGLVIIVVLVRWILRIDVIVYRLERIESHLDDIAGPRVKCDSCGMFWPKGRLMKIESRQNLCPECRKSFENRKG
jgi:hypothetical protein